METYNLTITLIKNGKETRQTFPNVVNYQIIEGKMFWIKELGKLTEDKKDPRYTSSVTWIPLDAIQLIEGTFTRHFKNALDLQNFKEGMNL